jgi:ATP-dependent DNA helicase RecG
MIRTESEMKRLTKQVLASHESEIIEYKEAKKNFGFGDLGKYFSALSNEANLRNAECGWLFFGVRDDRTICGTSYRKEEGNRSIGLQKLKHEISQKTNGGSTFEEIYEYEIDGKRVIAFQIPAASFATPATWEGIPWSRENESIVQMPEFKLQAIYGQSRPDWSRQIAYEANYDDLDPNAVEFACKKYVAKYSDTQPAVATLANEDLLSKMGLLIHGRITNAALVLLGEPESAVFLGGIEPRITWTLYSSRGDTVAYEHFEPPFILQVDKILGKIRNEKYRFFDNDSTLFPTEAQRYTPEVIRELLHNAIAHQDYRLSGKINVLEYEDKLVFKNEGAFIPGSIEEAIQSGYKPPYYRNPLLANAMSKTGMIDQNAIGIRNVFDIQRNRLLPMPTYDLSRANRVSVTIYGEVLNESYTRLLAAEPALELNAVLLLDMVQKRQPISKEQAKMLRNRGLVEGRYPNLVISSKVAAAIGNPEEYVRKKGLDSSICKELILKLLGTRPCSRAEIISAIAHALPENMSQAQREKHVSYLLQQLRRENKIRTSAATSGGKWEIAD